MTTTYLGYASSATSAYLDGQPVNVKASPFNAKGDGVTDDTAAITAALAALATGGALVFPLGTYKITAALAITKACTIFSCEGATVTQATTGQGAFTITASHVLLDGLTVVGPQYASQNVNEDAIHITGASAAAAISNVSIRNCTISTWGFYGIFAEFVTDLAILDNGLTNINYAAILGSSVQRGVIQGNRITNVTNGGANAYGISLTRRGNQTSLTDYPRSSAVSVSGNLVQDVPRWTGIDTHAGTRLTITGNTITNCKLGIHCGASTDATTADAYAPTEIAIAGNSLDSQITTGTATYGITLVGVLSGTPGASTDVATGTITGNVITGYGDETNSSTGAIYCYATRGVAIAGNALLAPSPVGIVLYQDNFGFACTGNTITDPWSNTNTNCPAIYPSIQYNQGTVSGNVLVRGSKSATYVCTRGLNVSSVTGNRVTVGPNDFFAATEAMVVGARGFLQRSPVVGLSNDNGDADATLTFGATDQAGAEIQFWSTTLTADRTATLAAATQPGAAFRIVRTGAGAHNLTIGSGVATLVQNEWCDVVWSGAAWVATAKGSLS